MNSVGRKAGGNPWKDVRLVDRLLAKVEQHGPMFTDGTRCWDWMGTRTTGGYGSLYRDGRRIQAHLVSYELYIGPVREGLELDHLCKRPCCVNPLHLEPVTRRENILRSTNHCAVNAAKTHCKRGHEFTPENTYLNKRGQRSCRHCHRDYERERRRKPS